MSKVQLYQGEIKVTLTKAVLGKVYLGDLGISKEGTH